MSITVDASVFVAAFVRQDVNHVESDQVVKRLVASAEEIVCPSIVLAKCACAVSRRTGNLQSAQAAKDAVDSIPGIRYTAIGRDESLEAADIGARSQLRGADSLYVMVAVAENSTLITWDGEMITRAAAETTVMTPSAWLAANP